MKKIELILGGLALVGLTLQLLLIPGGALTLGLSLTGLAILYYPFGFFYFNSIKISQIFKKIAYKGISILKGIGTFGAGNILAILVIGVMFKMSNLQGSGVMLGVGTTTGLILLIVVGIKYFHTRTQFFVVMFRRTLIWTILGLILFLIPNFSLIKIFNRDNPVYIEAYKKSMENPDDKDLMIKAEEERMKK